MLGVGIVVGDVIRDVVAAVELVVDGDSAAVELVVDGDSTAVDTESRAHAVEPSTAPTTLTRRICPRDLNAAARRPGPTRLP